MSARRISLLVVVCSLAIGCGRIGFDPGDGDAGDAAPPSVFTAIDLPPGGLASAIIRAPDQTLYAVLAFGRVVRSTSNGAAWTACASVGDRFVTSIALDPATGALYVGGRPDVLRSTDQCASWSPTGLGRSSGSLAVLAGKVFAGTNEGVWVMTSDTWAQVPTPMSGYVSDVAVDPIGGRVFVTGDNGIARSLDSGASWALVNTGLPVATVDFVALDPQQSQVLVAQVAPSTGESLYRSTDGGTTWSSCTGGGFVAAFDPADPNFLAFSDYAGGMKTSTNGGATFGTADLRSPQMSRTAVVDLAFDSTSGLYAATGRGIFHAPDHALAWSEIDAGLSAWDVTSILVASDGTLYLATDAGVMRSSDAGANWYEGSAGIINSSVLGGVVAVPGMPSSILVATINSIARSDDRGQTFTTLYVPGATEGFNITTLQLTGGKIIAGTPRGVVTSPPPWTTFSARQVAGADREVRALLPLDGAGTQLLAATDSGAFYSSDGGATFADVSTGLTDSSIDSLVRLSDGTLLAGTHQAGVFRATSPSGPWAPSGLDLEAVTALLAVPGGVVAATRHGVFVSADGTGWQPVYGLEQMRPQSLAVDAMGNLLVGTFGWGLYRTPLPLPAP